MKKHAAALVLIFAALLAACGASSRSAAPQPVVSQESVAPAAPAPSTANGGAALGSADGKAAAEAPPDEQEQQPGQAGADVARLVIKTAQLSLQVESVRDAEAAVRAKVDSLGGYIVTAQTSGTEPDISTDITFRVPSAQFDAALNGVQGMAQKVLSRSLGGEDVTEEYVDLDSRQRNLEATRDRLLALLQKADKVEDALAVNQALSDVQGQLEQIKGRMQYLRQSSAMATITVSLRPVPQTPIVEDNGWDPSRVFKLAARDLLEFGQGLVSFAIVLAVWLPVWGPLLAFFVWLWRKAARRMRRPAAPAAAPAPAPEPPAA